MSMQRKSLGRGLGAIISAGAKKVQKQPSAAKAAPKADYAKSPSTAISSLGLFTEIPVGKIAPAKYQARSEFSEEGLDALADSIASEGLLQPVLVRKLPDGNYELLAGERRLRACRKLGMAKIAACIQTASDSSAAAKGLIENMQRANLNPMEEAKGISMLVDGFRLTQEEAAKRLGKSRPAVANSLRLLKLPSEIQGYISSGRLSLGNAKVIMGLEDKSRQTLVARRVVECDLNVRGTEQLVRKYKDGAFNAPSASSASPRGSESARSAVIADIERKVSSRLNAKVEIRHGAKRGKIVIQYLGNEDLQRILDVFGIKI